MHNQYNKYWSTIVSNNLICFIKNCYNKHIIVTILNYFQYIFLTCLYKNK